MPCTDFYADREEAQRREREAAQVAAALCAILTTLEARPPALSNVLGATDWRPAGVTASWVVAWWRAHKERDRKRIQRERELEETARKRAAALRKLSSEERALLGI